LATPRGARPVTGRENRNYTGRTFVFSLLSAQPIIA
jgi:hypothetical protein